MCEVLSSAAEAELGALFHSNGKEACPLRIALDEMGHLQPATPMAIDTVKQKCSKVIDTCGSTGSATVFAKVNSPFSGTIATEPCRLHLQTSRGVAPSSNSINVFVLADESCQKLF